MTTREGAGVRFDLKKEGFLEEEYPQASELFRKVIKERSGTREEEKQLKKIWRKIGFDLLGKPVEDLFQLEKIESAEVPDYAPIFADEFCSNCGERFMATKGVDRNGEKLCLSCGRGDYFLLDGTGIREVQQS